MELVRGVVRKFGLDAAVAVESMKVLQMAQTVHRALSTYFNDVGKEKKKKWFKSLW